MPTAAEGGGRRPEFTKPDPSSDNQPWRSAGCPVQSHSAGISHCPLRDAFGMRCGIVILHGATAWRRARLEDEGLAAQPLASLLICGARALLRCAAALPLADEPFVGLFGMTGQLDLPITQRFDIVSVSRATFVAFPGRLPGLQLHGAQLAGDQRRACPLIGSIAASSIARNSVPSRRRSRSSMRRGTS